MTRCRAAPAAALLGLLVGAAAAALPGAAPAREVFARGDVALDVSGSVRELLVATGGTDADRFAEAARGDPARCLRAASFAGCAAFGTVNEWFVPTSLTRLRTRARLRLGPGVSAVAVYDHELLAGRLDSFGGDLGSQLAGSSFFGAEDDIAGGDRVRWRHLLYRGYLLFEWKRAELTLGRQRIPWGVGRLWNPIDRFNAIPPLALEADQSAGIDAVDLRIRFSGFTFLEAVYAADRDAEEAAYALRLHGVLRDTDYSLVAGVFDGARTLGFDLAGNLGGAAARLEWVYTDPTRDVWPVGSSRPRELDDFFQVVASIDHLFGVGTGLYVIVEHLYNGNALGFGRGRAGVLLPFFEATDEAPPGLPVAVPGPFVTVTNEDRFGGSQVVTASENLTGLQLGYDLTPELRFEWITIFDWDGRSASFFPALRYTVLDWLEVTLGAQAFVGPRRSQFGDAEPLGFLLLEAFF